MTLEELSNKLYESKILHDYKDGKIDYRKVHEFIVGLNESLAIPVVGGSYYWVKLMTDDKHEPAMAINLLGVMNFQFFNGVAVPCDKVNDYSECNYR